MVSAPLKSTDVDAVAICVARTSETFATVAILVAESAVGVSPLAAWIVRFVIIAAAFCTETAAIFSASVAFGFPATESGSKVSRFMPLGSDNFVEITCVARATSL